MKTIAIIGGGLAGTACAYILKKRGFTPVIYEAGATLAPGASGNETGLYNPRLSAEKNAGAEYFTFAFHRALEDFPGLGDIGWNKCGALHLITGDKRRERLEGCARSWNWPHETLHLVDSDEASRIAGVPVVHEALYIPQSGVVSPRRLCAAYAKDIDIIYNAPVTNPGDIDADIVILANGVGVKNTPQGSFLPLKTVRGQVTLAGVSDISAKLQCALCYGGYIAPTANGIHTLGATFQRWLTDTEAKDEDDAYNMDLLAQAAPTLVPGLQITGHRAALRTVTPDHFPVVGALSDHIYVSTGHGSHGILSALAAANLLADMISGAPTVLPAHVIEKLGPSRFRV